MASLQMHGGDLPSDVRFPNDGRTIAVCQEEDGWYVIHGEGRVGPFFTRKDAAGLANAMAATRGHDVHRASAQHDRRTRVQSVLGSWGDLGNVPVAKR
jgi:hypothetical protein